MKALIAMSGGVDSSVSALLIKKRGYDIIGCTMKLYESTEDIKNERTCCSLDDTYDARSVCFKLGAKYYVFNYKDAFKEKVIDKFITTYEKGMTPNPCIDCNRYMKFDMLLEKAKVLGCDYIVTGHYARIENVDGEYYLKKGIDESKDQSYVLYNLTQDELKHILFPLGEYRKDEIRKMASDEGFINANKKDSQDICFVQNGDYVSVIKSYSNKKYENGDIKLSNGKVIGKHNGIISYTVGQRKGLGISYSKPLYVCDICTKDNSIIVGDIGELLKEEFLTSDINIINEKYKINGLKCKVKTRYHKVEVDATLFFENDNIRVKLDEKQRDITKGQSAVFYDGDIVIGGGIITSIIR